MNTAVIKVVGKHALVVGCIAAGATAVVDMVKLIEASQSAARAAAEVVS